MSSISVWRLLNDPVGSDICLLRFDRFDKVGDVLFRYSKRKNTHRETSIMQPRVMYTINALNLSPHLFPPPCEAGISIPASKFDSYPDSFKFGHSLASVGSIRRVVRSHSVEIEQDATRIPNIRLGWWQ